MEFTYVEFADFFTELGGGLKPGRQLVAKAGPRRGEI
jgi:hypothetical protein